MAEPQQLLDGDTEADRLRTALEAVETELRLHSEALVQLQGELKASRMEVAGTRGDTIHHQGIARQARAEIDSLRALTEQLQAVEIPRGLEIIRLNQGIAELQAQNAALMASFSWRVTRPVRSVSWRAKRLKARWFPQPVPAPAPPPLPGPVDPNAAYLFKPAPSPAVTGGPLALDDLHHLSRSL